jgi:hypothetical protein
MSSQEGAYAPADFVLEMVGGEPEKKSCFWSDFNGMEQL